MSTAAAPRPTHRLWLPLLVLLGGPAAGAAIWYWPSDWDYGHRTLSVLALGFLSLVLLALWLLFLSRLPHWLRVTPVAVLVAAVGALALSVREAHFTGDMLPTFVFRWDQTRDEALEEHRRTQAERPPETQLKYDGRPTNLIYCDFLGARRDGVVTDTRLVTDWDASSPHELWRQPSGGGYSGFALGGWTAGRAVTIEQRRDEEAAVCYEATSGRELWAHKYPAAFRERQGGDGPRATPVIAALDSNVDRKGPSNFKVFALGATGVLSCLDLNSGAKEWSADILRDNANLTWGMSGSPLVFDGPSRVEVIVTPGAQTDAAKGRAVIVYDARTGEERRAFGSHRGSYSSPVLAKLCGLQQLLVFDGDGLTGYEPKAGKELWHHPWVTLSGGFINVAQPVVLDGDRVFISSGYDKGCAMLRVRKDGPPEVLWQNTLMRCKFTSPVYRDGYLYGLDEGILVCLDAATGERKWKDGRYGHGQLLLVDRNLLILSESGKLALVEATPERFHEWGKVAALTGKTWNPLALSMGLVFVRNDHEMACYELAGEAMAERSGALLPLD